MVALQRPTSGLLEAQQTVWVLDEANTVIKSHRVSGRQDPLHQQPGTYQVWSRSRYTFAINNPSITWGYLIRFATGGNGGNIGFHDIPIQYGQPVQTIAQLGQALSGGCVRQANDDAVWMWNWAGLAPWSWSHPESATPARGPRQITSARHVG